MPPSIGGMFHQPNLLTVQKKPKNLRKRDKCYVSRENLRFQEPTLKHIESFVKYTKILPPYRFETSGTEVFMTDLITSTAKVLNYLEQKNPVYPYQTSQTVFFCGSWQPNTDKNKKSFVRSYNDGCFPKWREEWKLNTANQHARKKPMRNNSVI